MLSNNKFKLEIGDWVKGKSQNGELIIGYIETIDLLQGITGVTVITSDNKETIGKTIKMLNKWVERLPVSAIDHEEQLLHLIDLALTTGDEDWFIELSVKLSTVRQLELKS
jgi:uncharacterized protein YpiB (UPF0302 family)